MKFIMEIEPHKPEHPDRMCDECALQSGPMCMDITYCEFRKTGMTWKKSNASSDEPLS